MSAEIHPLATLLEILGRAPDEPLCICHQHPDVQGAMPFTWTTVAAAPAIVDRYAGVEHVWFGVQPMDVVPATGRGGQRDVSGLVTLYVDLDYLVDGKPTGMEPTTAMDIIGDLAEILDAEPSAIVASGYGAQPYWPTERISPVEGALLLARWRALVIDVALKRGVSIDSGVYDLARILRVPGPPNLKRRTSAITGLIQRPGRRLTLAEVTAALDAHAPVTPELRKAHTANVVRLNGVTAGEAINGHQGDRVFTDVEAMEFIEKFALSRVRSTPWGAGGDFWKVIWEAAMTCSNFTEMFSEDYLRDLIRDAVAEGHGGVCTDAGDEYQITMGFLKGREWLARRPTEAELSDAFSTHCTLTPIVPTTAPRADLTAGAASNAPGGLPYPVGLPEEFWAARPALAHLRLAAQAGRACPEAALLAAQAEVLAHIMPNVVLPNIDQESEGGTSLNVLNCVVAPSGVGKDEAAKVARSIRIKSSGGGFGHDAIGPHRCGVGSGEGVGAKFVARHKRFGPDYPLGVGQKNPVVLKQIRFLVHAEISEADSLAKLMERAGNTLLPELRKAAMGQRLGFDNADANKNYPVAAGTYRYCALTLAQPEKIGWLLQDNEGGTPQRYGWACAVDPTAPDERPASPGLWTITLPSKVLASELDGTECYPPGLADLAWIKIPLCPQATAAVDHNRRIGLRGQQIPAEAHSMLARLKFGTFLGLLDGRVECSCEDWELAGVFMAYSTRVRNWVLAVLAAEAEKKEAITFAGRGRGRLLEETTYESAKAKARVDTKDRLIEVITQAGEVGISNSDLIDQKLTAGQRPAAPSILDALAAIGEVHWEPGRQKDSKRWFLGPGP